MKITRKLILILTALSLTMGPVSMLEARSQKKEASKKKSRRHLSGRGARAGGFIVGAGAGAGIAAAASSHHKWIALGAPLGGVAGYFLVRAIQKGRNNNRHKKNQELKNNNR